LRKLYCSNRRFFLRGLPNHPRDTKSANCAFFVAIFPPPKNFLRGLNLCFACIAGRPDVVSVPPWRCVTERPDFYCRGQHPKESSGANCIWLAPLRALYIKLSSADQSLSPRCFVPCVPCDSYDPGSRRSPLRITIRSVRDSDAGTGGFQSWCLRHQASVHGPVT